MPLKTLVKVGAITNLSEARYCAGMGVDMLGFNVVEDTDNFISAKNYQDIRGWLSGPKFVTEIYKFKHNTPGSVIENYAPDFLELDLEDLTRLPNNIVTPLILSIDEVTFEKYQEHIDQWKQQIAFVILQQSKNNTTFNSQITKQFPVLISPSANKDIQQMVDSLNAKGIVLNGSSEIKPGLKNYDHLADVLEQLEVE